MKVFNVLRFEVLSAIRRRSFWMMTFFLPAIITFMGVGTQLLAERSMEDLDRQARDFALQRAGLVDLAGILREIPPDVPRAALQLFSDESSGRQALARGEIEILYILPRDFRRQGQVRAVVAEFMPFANMQANELLEYVLYSNLLGEPRWGRLAMAPLRDLQVESLAPPSIAAPSEPNEPTANVPYYLPYGLTLLFFLPISLTGSLMLTSVTKEKENRTMEILLTSLHPRQLMLGKLLGLALVAGLQISAWILGGRYLLPRTGLDISLIRALVEPSFLLWALAFLLLGYLLYASLLGAIGALAPTAREAGQFVFLITLPLFVPLVLNSLFAEAPNSTAAVALSLFPLTAPVAMAVRLAFANPPLWQPLAALALLAFSALGIVSFAARFFRPDTLLSSSQLSLGRLWRELRRRGAAP